MLKHLAGLGLAFCLLASSAGAAPDPSVRNDVGVCDPSAPLNCLKPNTDGSINIGGGGGGVAGSLFNNAATVSTSATRLPAQVLANGVTLKADVSNLYTIYVGGAGVSVNNGFPLEPGQTVNLPVSNLNVLYIVSASSTTDTLHYIGN